MLGLITRKTLSTFVRTGQESFVRMLAFSYTVHPQFDLPDWKQRSTPPSIITIVHRSDPPSIVSTSTVKYYLYWGVPGIWWWTYCSILNNTEVPLKPPPVALRRRRCSTNNAMRSGSQPGNNDIWWNCWCSTAIHLVDRWGCLLHSPVSGLATYVDGVWVVQLFHAFTSKTAVLSCGI